MQERAPGLRFTLFGFPVLVEPWFFIIPALALQTRDVPGAVLWAALVFVGVLVHELGHAFAMRRFGLTPWIQLHGMGGATHFPPGANPTPRQHFFITLAGPAFGLCLGVVALIAQQLNPLPSAQLATALSDAVWINVGWSVINLLPLLPWDGGFLLDAGLTWLTGKRHDRVVALSSLVLGSFIVALAMSQRSFLIGYFGLMGVIQGWGRWKHADQHAT